MAEIYPELDWVQGHPEFLNIWDCNFYFSAKNEKLKMTRTKSDWLQESLIPNSWRPILDHYRPLTCLIRLIDPITNWVVNVTLPPLADYHLFCKKSIVIFQLIFCHLRISETWKGLAVNDHLSFVSIHPLSLIPFETLFIRPTAFHWQLIRISQTSGVDRGAWPLSSLSYTIVHHCTPTYVWNKFVKRRDKS